MATIARTGGIAFTDPLVLAVPAEDAELFFRHPDRPETSPGRASWASTSSGRRPGRVFPEFFHLFPAFGAYPVPGHGRARARSPPRWCSACSGPSRFLRLPPAPRATPPALLGALLLATNVVQVWFARYPGLGDGVPVPVSSWPFWPSRASRRRRARPSAASRAPPSASRCSCASTPCSSSCPSASTSAIAWPAATCASEPLLALLVPFALLAAHAAAARAFCSRGSTCCRSLTRRYWTSRRPCGWRPSLASSLLASGCPAAWGPSLACSWIATRTRCAAAAGPALVLLARLRVLPAACALRLGRRRRQRGRAAPRGPGLAPADPGLRPPGRPRCAVPSTACPGS